MTDSPSLASFEVVTAEYVVTHWPALVSSIDLWADFTAVARRRRRRIGWSVCLSAAITSFQSRTRSSGIKLVEWADILIGQALL
jgi:hypothetical protein